MTRGKEEKRAIADQSGAPEHPNGCLRNIELRQEAILNNIPDIAWLKDNQSTFMAVNDAFCMACGFSAKEVIGKTD